MNASVLLEQFSTHLWPKFKSWTTDSIHNNCSSFNKNVTKKNKNKKSKKNQKNKPKNKQTKNKQINLKTIGICEFFF